MARVPDQVPRIPVPAEVPDSPDDLIAPDPLGDPEDDWDPDGLKMFGRWLTRAYLRAQADGLPDE